jgi:hypothetical protein
MVMNMQKPKAGIWRGAAETPDPFTEIPPTMAALP